MGLVAHNRTNIAPNKIPWELIRTLIAETYGGKIDNEDDFKQLSDLVDQTFVPSAFEQDHKLVKAGPDGGDDSLVVPEGNEMRDFMAWVNNLPEREPPTYLGLPANAEKLLLVGYGKQTIRSMVKITEILDESEQLSAEDATQT